MAQGIHLSGIELVVKNLGGFTSQLGRGQKSYEQLERAAERAAKAVRNTSLSFSRAQSGVTAAVTKLSAVSKEYSRALASRIVAEERLKTLQSSGTAKAREIASAERDVVKTARELVTWTGRLATSQKALDDALGRSLGAYVDLENAQENLKESQEELAQSTEATAGQLISSFGGGVAGGGGIAGGISAIASVAPQAAAALALIGAAGIVARAGVNALHGALNLLGNVLQFVGNVARTVVVGGVNLMVGALKGLFNVISSITRPFREFFGQISRIALGIAFYNYVRSLHIAFTNLVEEVFRATSSFQKLEIQLSALAARDFAREAGVPMAEAFEATSGAAANLFDWLRRLAVQTPFTVEDISRSYAMSLAMGLNTKVSRELTTSLIEFVAGMGLTDEHMFRIIYNLGQMVQRGKITGEEFRDLARNLFPLTDIMEELAEEAGMSTESFKELALEGGVPVMAFLEKFIEIANRDFPDAAKKMARTLEGVTSNFRDFIQAFIGVDVFKPVIDRITGILADALDKMLNSEELSRGTKLIGQALLRSFELLIQPVNRLVEALGNLWNSFHKAAVISDEMWQKLGEEVPKSESKFSGWARTIAKAILTVALIIQTGLRRLTAFINEHANSNTTTFEDIIKKAKDWGLRFIKAFADGITFGLKFITSIIKIIASILKTWFAPGSPPKIAPNIDKWGASTMEEWIKGFSSADFNLFEDLAGLIESFLRSITADIGEENIIPRIFGSRADIASAIALVKNGTISIGDAINMVTKGLTGARSEFAGYVMSLFAIAQAEEELKAASEAVSVAQEEVNAVTTKYDAILNELESQLTEVTEGFDEEVRLREIADALTNQRLTAEERERLTMEKRGIEIRRQIRGVEDQRDAEVSAAEARLEEARLIESQAKSRLELLQSQAEAYRSQIELIIENNNLLQDQIDLLERLKEEASEVEEEIEGGIIDPELTEPPDTTALEEALDEIDKLLAEAQKSADGFWQGLQTVWDTLSSPEVQGAFDEFKSTLGELGGVMKDVLGLGEGESIFDKFSKGWEKIREALGIPADTTTIEFIADKIVEISDKVSKAREAFDREYAPLKNALGNIADALIGWATAVSGAARIIGVAFGDMDKFRDDDPLALIVQRWMRLRFEELTEAIKGFVLIVGQQLLNLALILAGMVSVISSAAELADAALKLLRGEITLEQMQAMRVQNGQELQAIVDQYKESQRQLYEALFFQATTAPPFGNRQFGGRVRGGYPYVVGERGPELMVPAMSGVVVPQLPRFYEQMLANQGGRAMAAAPSYSTQNIDRSVHVEVNPTYKNVESEAGIYHDVTAALASAWR